MLGEEGSNLQHPDPESGGLPIDLSPIKLIRYHGFAVHGARQLLPPLPCSLGGLTV